MISQDDLKQLNQNLQDYDDVAQETIREWEKTYKRAAITANLAENPAVIMIMERANKAIEDINTVLMNLEDLSSEDRKVLIRDRARWQWFLGLFVDAKAAMETVETNIKSELNNKDEED